MVFPRPTKSKGTGIGFRKKDGIKPRLNAKSGRREKDERVYKAVRELILEVIPVCCFCRRNKAVEIHHKRGRIGRTIDKVSFYWAPIYLIPVCKECHPPRHLNLDPRSEKEKSLLTIFYNKMVSKVGFYENFLVPSPETERVKVMEAVEEMRKTP